MKAGFSPPVDQSVPPGDIAVTSAAAGAFDAAASDFDARYGAWASVAAQRRAVRRHLDRLFPIESRLLELGGGTGEDAAYLAGRGCDILVTDPAPQMVEATRRKAEARGLTHRMVAQLADASRLAGVATTWRAQGLAPFDGAYSNFAGLNCVDDLSIVANGLAPLLRPGAAVALVLFGPLPPGEILVQLARRKPKAAIRRVRRGPVSARLKQTQFSVWYHRPSEIERAFQPAFRLERRIGIGIFVPPSAAEPGISNHPHVLTLLERLDAMFERPLALLGDHILYEFRRTDVRGPVIK